MYNKKSSSSDPALIIILIDQSGSMSEIFFQDRTVAKTVKHLCDKILYQILKDHTLGEKIKPRTELAVIGYGSSIRSAMPKIGIEEFPFSVSKLPDTYIKRNDLSDNSNEKITEHEPPPLEWVEDVSNGGTAMLGAFIKTKEIIEKWIPDHRNSFPPVVINITDGFASDDINLLERLKQWSESDENINLGDLATLDIVSMSKQIQKLATNDGNVLFCNAHLSIGGEKEILYPISTKGIDNPIADLTFEMSSRIPDNLVQLGIKKNLPVQSGSRFLLFNAQSVKSILDFIEFGSSAMR